MNEGDVDIHAPFTIEENIHQLNAIDASIAQLMDHTTTALNALSIPSLSNPPPSAPSASEPATKPTINPAAQKEAFRSATNSFLATLHSIDVRMRRQIYALDEAGIVSLAPVPRQGPDNSKASLKPNGVGSVGNLDVGWLNSRGMRVERDMEAELWRDAKQFLEKDGNKLQM